MKNKEVFQLVVDELNAAVFEWNLQDGTFYSSEAYQKYAISKVSPEQILHNAGPLDVIYEEDHEALLQFFKETKSGKDRTSVTLRLKMMDGSFRWCRMVALLYRDEAGKLFRVVGIIMDIHEEKEREHGYEERLHLSKALAQESLAVASYNLTKNIVTDASSEIPELLRLMRQNSVDAVLKNIREDTLNKEEEERFAPAYSCRDLLQAFEAGTTHIEVRHHIKNDNRWMQTSFDMFRNPYTQEVEAIAMLRDIQNDVRAEMVVNRLLTVDYEVIMTMDIRTGFVSTFWAADSNQAIRELSSAIKDRDSVNMASVQFFQKYAVEENRERVIRENSPEVVLQALEKSPVYVSVYSLNLRGTIRHKRMIYAYLDEDRDTVLCAVQDVTDTYEQEEKQRKELEAALNAAKIANQSKTEFLARMSHDMRTPMNGILGLAELSEQEDDPKILRDNMAKVSESGKYLLELINDTLDFQKLESGKMTLNPQVVCIGTICNNVLNMINPAVHEKGVNLEVHKSDVDMEQYLRMDSIRFTQIIFNLLTNAVKFTPRGGKIRLECRKLFQEGNIVHNCISIADTGIGMSETFIQQGLYKPFSQEKNAVSAEYAGSGLGLSIVYSLVEMMGGRIEVESKLGEGTTFTIYLDFELVPEEEAGNVRKENQSRKFILSEELMGKKILLVEDHPLNARIATKMLERAGCEVTWMNDGQKGVETFEKSGVGTYDGILMDIRMPVMNGLEAARAIRALPREDAKSVPIIAMTANAYDEDIQKSLEAGMNTHLSKPINMEKFYETLAAFMKN